MSLPSLPCLPAQLRALPPAALPQVVDDVRQTVINAVAAQGGHLGAGLGVAELTVALHYVYNTPDDLLVWDVGHQTYPHKAITGRADQLHTLRQQGGLSGFTCRSESVYDPFGAAHSSTSISAALGMALARDRAQQTHQVVCVIGDGALSAGMAFEALNNLGASNTAMVVILNDNDLSIAPPTGALRTHLTALRQGDTHNNLFTALGIHYIGVVDGHNLDALLPALQTAKDLQRPVLLHVTTQKGKGYALTETRADGGHAVPPYNSATAQLLPASTDKPPTYTKVFSQELLRHAQQDAQIVAITAAMPEGTGLSDFAKQFAHRFYDVGIAEQHAVTFAAGLACAGNKPFVAIYSTFLQRAYDQVVHDVALQNLPVRFMLDRAGLVGADGATHAGVFDTAYLSCLPNFVLMAPANEAQLVHAIATAVAINHAPCAVRYPRGEGTGEALPAQPQPWRIGEGHIVQQGDGDTAILSYGTRLQAAQQAADLLQQQHNISITLADARFAKPLDVALILNLAQNHQQLIILEDSIGFAPLVLTVLAQHNVHTAVKVLALPDAFLPHAPQNVQYAAAGLDAIGIVRTVLAR